jgi:hypothetical protein
MKKPALIVLTLVFAFALAACGQKSNTNTAVEASASVSPSVDASPTHSSSPSEAPKDSPGLAQEEVPSTKEAAAPSKETIETEESSDPDAPAPLLPIGNLETDENGEVVGDPSQDAPSDNGVTAEGYEGLNIYVVSNEWSSKDKCTYVTIEVENGSKKSVEANSDLFVAITVDKALVENGVGSGFKSMKIMPGGKAKFEMNYSIEPEEIAGFALMKDYGEDPLRAIITNPNVGGN